MRNGTSTTRGLRRLLLAVALVLPLAVAAPAQSAAPGSGPAVTYQVKEMIRGAQIHGAYGLTVDAAGRLLVASPFGGEIVAVDRRTGKIVDRLGHEVGVDGPAGVAIGPDGSVYWTDLIAGEVGRLAPDGTTSKQPVAASVIDIAFSRDGRLFVGQGPTGDGLYELDPQLAQPVRVVIPASGTPPFASALGGFDFGPDGYLYAPQPYLGRIVKIDPDTGDVLNVVAEGFTFPSAVQFDAQDRLFAIDGAGSSASQTAGRVVTVDIDGGTFATVATTRGAPERMAFDDQGRLYVSDAYDGAVYVIAGGAGVRTLVKGGLILPAGVAVMPGTGRSESLLVADLFRLVELDARSGRQLGYEGFRWLNPEGITQPSTVAADGGNVILTSGLNNVVQVWDPRANRAVANYPFPFPTNALRFGGDLVVSDLGTGTARVVRQAADGAQTVLASGQYLPLYVPKGMAATDTKLWVADYVTGCIWQLAGAPGVVPGTCGPNDGLKGPEGMAVDADGSLLVVESSAGRLTRIDPATGASSTVADGLVMDIRGPAVFEVGGWVTSSVAVDSTGTILVSAAGAQGSVIYRIKAVPAS